MSIKCPSCGDTLIYNIAQQDFKCVSCMSHYSPQEVWKLEPSQVQTLDMYQFTCPYCGGEIYSADNAAVSKCSYCGSDVTLTPKLVEWKKPKEIVPFEVTRQEAAAKIKEKMKTWYAPKELSQLEQPECYKAIYMPYWEYTVKVHSKAERTKVTESEMVGYIEYVNVYELTAEGQMMMKGHIHDASSTFADDLSVALGSFTSTKGRKRAVPFHEAYFNGYYADVADLKPEECVEGMEAKVIEKAGQTVLADVTSSESYEQCFENKTKRMQKKSSALHKKDAYFDLRGLGSMHYADKKPLDVTYEIESAELVMCPVWFLSFRSGKRMIYGVVNGINGMCVCDVPIDIKKMALVAGVGTGISFLFYMLLFHLDIKSSLGVALEILLFTLAIFVSVRKKLKKREKGQVEYGDDDKKSTPTRVFAQAIGIVMLFCLGIFLIPYFIGAEIGALLVARFGDLGSYLASFGVIACIAGLILETIRENDKLISRDIPQFHYKGGDTKDV